MSFITPPYFAIFHNIIIDGINYDIIRVSIDSKDKYFIYDKTKTEYFCADVQA